MSSNDRGPGTNSTADRAVRILLLFSDDRRSISAPIVSDTLGISRSSAYRYLQSLRAAGFLQDAERGRYVLGPQIFRLWRLATEGHDLTDIALPIMRELSAHVGEAVVLTRRVDANVICIARVDSPRRIRLSYEPGQIMPIYAGAHASILLAWEPDHVVDDVLARTEFARLTESTITDESELRARLSAIERQGYAISRGETERHLVGIAAPVWGRRQEVVGGFGVAGLEFDFTEDRIPSLVAAVTGAADRLSHVLADHGF